MNRFTYTTYPFTATVVANQLLFTFTGIPTDPTKLVLPSVYYVNLPNLSIKIDRLNNNLVHFGDQQGVITVDYTLSTNPSPAGGLPNWIDLIIGAINRNTHDLFNATKSSAQTFPALTYVNAIFNNVINSSSSLSYNPFTGVFTVLETGDYQINSVVLYNTQIANLVMGLRTPANATFLTRYSTPYRTNSTVYIGKLDVTYPFNVGDTFSIGVYNTTAVGIPAYVAEPNGFYISIKKIPTQTY